MYLTFNLPAISLISKAFPLNVKDEVLDVTCSPSTFTRAFKISSVIPSLKYSCSGASLMLLKGKTVMDGTSGRGNAMRWTEAGSSTGTQGSSQTINPPAKTKKTAVTAAITFVRRGGRGLDTSDGGGGTTPGFKRAR